MFLLILDEVILKINNCLLIQILNRSNNLQLHNYINREAKENISWNDIAFKLILT